MHLPFIFQLISYFFVLTGTANSSGDFEDVRSTNLDPMAGVSDSGFVAADGETLMTVPSLSSSLLSSAANDFPNAAVQNTGDIDDIAGEDVSIALSSISDEEDDSKTEPTSTSTSTSTVSIVSFTNPTTSIPSTEPVEGELATITNSACRARNSTVTETITLTVTENIPTGSDVIASPSSSLSSMTTVTAQLDAEIIASSVNTSSSSFTTIASLFLSESEEVDISGTTTISSRSTSTKTLTTVVMVSPTSLDGLNTSASTSASVSVSAADFVFANETAAQDAIAANATFTGLALATGAAARISPSGVSTFPTAAAAVCGLFSFLAAFVVG